MVSDLVFEDLISLKADDRIRDNFISNGRF